MKIILESIQDIQEFKKVIGGGCNCSNNEEPKKEEPKKEEPKKEEPKKEEPKKEEPKGVTKAEVQKICKEKIKAGKTEEVKKVIEAHGAKNISDINEEDYANVIAEVEAL